MTFWLTSLFRSRKRLASRFFGLPSREQYLLIRALILLWTVRLRLWTFSFQTVNSSMARQRSSIKQTKNLSEEQIIWAVKVTSQFVPHATCLTQAITARSLLSEHGYSADLRIGVAHESDRLMAHAWLEKEGRVLIGGSISDFKPLPMEKREL